MAEARVESEARKPTDLSTYELKLHPMKNTYAFHYAITWLGKLVYVVRGKDGVNDWIEPVHDDMMKRGCRRIGIVQYEHVLDFPEGTDEEFFAAEYPGIVCKASPTIALMAVMEGVKKLTPEFNNVEFLKSVVTPMPNSRMNVCGLLSMEDIPLTLTRKAWVEMSYFDVWAILVGPSEDEIKQIFEYLSFVKPVDPKAQSYLGDSPSDAEDSKERSVETFDKMGILYKHVIAKNNTFITRSVRFHYPHVTNEGLCHPQLCDVWGTLYGALILRQAMMHHKNPAEIEAPKPYPEYFLLIGPDTRSVLMPANDLHLRSGGKDPVAQKDSMFYPAVTKEIYDTMETARSTVLSAHMRPGVIFPPNWIATQQAMGLVQPLGTEESTIACYVNVFPYTVWNDVFPAQTNKHKRARK